jgi:pimeloyl-ACP methyl ester carboxylesterase
MALPYKQSPQDNRRTRDAFMSHGGTAARLPPIAAPTLVLAGGRDPTAAPADRSTS